MCEIMAATRNMVGERIKSLARLAAIERMRRPAVRPSVMDSIPDKGDDVESLCAALPELLGSERHEQRARLFSGPRSLDGAVGKCQY
jgi:hypothetical protein